MLTLLNSSLRSVVVKLEMLAASEVLTPQYLEKLKKRSQEIAALAPWIVFAAGVGFVNFNRSL